MSDNNCELDVNKNTTLILDTSPEVILDHFVLNTDFVINTNGLKETIDFKDTVDNVKNIDFFKEAHYIINQLKKIINISVSICVSEEQEDVSENYGTYFPNYNLIVFNPSNIKTLAYDIHKIGSKEPKISNLFRYPDRSDAYFALRIILYHELGHHLHHKYNPQEYFDTLGTLFSEEKADSIGFKFSKLEGDDKYLKISPYAFYEWFHKKQRNKFEKGSI